MPGRQIGRHIYFQEVQLQLTIQNEIESHQFEKISENVKRKNKYISNTDGIFTLISSLDTFRTDKTVL